MLIGLAAAAAINRTDPNVDTWYEDSPVWAPSTASQTFASQEEAINFGRGLSRGAGKFYQTSGGQDPIDFGQDDLANGNTLLWRVDAATYKQGQGKMYWAVVDQTGKIIDRNNMTIADQSNPDAPEAAISAEINAVETQAIQAEVEQEVQAELQAEEEAMMEAEAESMAMAEQEIIDEGE